MNKFSTTLLMSIFTLQVMLAQSLLNIHVSGKHILGPCNDTLILKGVNYAPYNWGWSNTQLRVNQVALTGANCIRLPWYVSTPDGPTPQATYSNLVFLDSALSKCIQNKLIPIIELHDETCKNNTTALTNLSNWFIQASVKNLITKYKHSLILNIANEALFVAWASNTVTAVSSFTTTYSSIVNTIRTNSITVPLLIDAPDCGTNLDVIANVGQALQNTDPLKNLIFSSHMYWFAYAGNDSTQALVKINNALSKNIPFIFGEVANLQDDVSMCQYTLNYKPWLRILKQKKIGWLAWSWDNDGCPARQLSTNGNFSSLTAFGTDIINNAVYGLAVGTVKSKYLTLNGCGSTYIEQNNSENDIQIFPNPSNETLSVFVKENGIASLCLSSITGKTVYTSLGSESKKTELDVSSFADGFYILTIATKNNSCVKKKILIQH